MSRLATEALRHAGVDLSYTGTGFVIINSECTVLEHSRITTDTGRTDYERIEMIWSVISATIAPHTPCTITIENYAHGGPQLAKAVRLGEIFRNGLDQLGMSWSNVAPSTLKKFATGNGRASKEQMIEAARERWPMCPNNDEADAFHLACWGLQNSA